MGNEIEVKGFIGLDPSTDPLAKDQTNVESSKPKSILMHTTVSKQYPQTNDQISTQFQSAGIWLILFVIILWLIRKEWLKKEPAYSSKE